MQWEHLTDCDSGGWCNSSEDGLALVSATDGRTVWATTVVPPTDTPLSEHIEVVTDDVVLVSVEAAGLSDDHDAPPLRTLAIDARTGAMLWESQDPMWPRAVVGETVVGAVQVPNSPKWMVVGADLRTGQRTWTRPGGLDESAVEAVAGDVALLRGKAGTAPGSERLVFVDVATGRTVTELDHPEKFISIETSAKGKLQNLVSCADDGDTMIVCAGRDDTSDADTAAADDDLLAIFRVDRRTVTTELVDYGALRVIDGWHGRAQLSGNPPGDPRLEFTVDSAGNVIDKDLRLPGRLEELTADQATFLTGKGIEVYKRL